MEEVVFKAQPRTVVGKQVRALRREGLLPAVIYGHHMAEQVMICLNLHDVSQMLPRISSSQIVTVDVDGKRHATLVREKQRHPVTGVLMHIDFQAVRMDEKIRVMVAIETRGEAPAVKNFNGIPVINREQLEVEALPGNLPGSIVVDLTTLEEIGASISVRDLDLPADVVVLEDPEETVIVITAPASEAEMAALEGGPVEPEVIEKGKKEEEEAE